MNKENEVIVNFVGFKKAELQLLNNRIQLPENNVTLLVGTDALDQSDLIIHRLPNVITDEIPNNSEDFFRSSILKAGKQHLLVIVQSFPYLPAIRNIMQNVESWPDEVRDLRTFEEGDLGTTIDLLVVMLEIWYRELLQSLITTAEIGNISLYDSRSRSEVFINGQFTYFTKQEFTLFKALMASPNKMVSKQELLRTVWPYDQSETLHTRDAGLNVLCFKVNNILKKHGASHLIVSINHHNYQLTQVSQNDSHEEN